MLCCFVQINLSYSYSQCDICDKEKIETYSVYIIQHLVIFTREFRKLKYRI